MHYFIVLRHVISKTAFQSVEMKALITEENCVLELEYVSIKGFSIFIMQKKTYCFVCCSAF